MLEITFLGTGSGVPTPRRNHSAIYLRYGEHNFLWDCGEGTQKQIMKSGLNFMKIDKIFITHWHADHWAGLIGLIQTMNLEKRQKALEIYAPEAEKFIGDILDMDYWGPRFEIIPINIQFQKPEISVLVKEKDFSITSIPMKHSVPSVAFCFQEEGSWNVDVEKSEKLYGLKQGPLIGKLKEKGEIELKGKKIKLEDVAVLNQGLKVAYSGDTKPNQAMVKLAQDADLLIHESTFGEEIDDTLDRAHTRVTDAAEIAKKAGVKQLILTHFSRRYQDVSPLLKIAKEIFPKTEAAEDYMRVELKREGIQIKKRY